MKNEERLLKIIRAYLNNQYDIKIDGDLAELYKLSNNLNVSTITAYVLNKINIKNNLFENVSFKAINKYERLQQLTNNINKLFDEKIEYVFVKGATISKYYDEPYLRYSGDIDVVVNSGYKRAYDVLLNNGLKILLQNKQETVFRYNGYNIDLHRSFSENNDKYESIFSNLINNNHELDINYKYIYCLMHASKHLLYGQLTLRTFIDIFYLRKLIDKDIVNELLKKVDLVDFNNALNSYLNVLLGEKEYEEIDNKIEHFIFEYALDNGNKNRVLINSYGKSSIAYLLSRLFIPYENMSYDYPILKKYKVLLPLFYVVRLFKPFKYKRGKYTYNELKNSGNRNNNDITNMHDFIKDIGLV